SRATGGIQSIFHLQRRGNQFSQQLAMRLAAPAASWQPTGEEAEYSQMRAESVELTTNCGALGEIVSRGGLFNGEGQQLARFRQTVRVWAGNPVIDLEIELDELQELRGDPWNSYYAARFAWPDESAELSRGVGLTRVPTEIQRFEAPEYVE